MSDDLPQLTEQNKTTRHDVVFGPDGMLPTNRISLLLTQTLTLLRLDREIGPLVRQVLHQLVGMVAACEEGDSLKNLIQAPGSAHP